MLFFFELGLFLLIMATLILGEFVGRGAALVAWLLTTAGSLGGYLLARRSLASLAAGTAGSRDRMRTSHPADAETHGGHARGGGGDLDGDGVDVPAKQSRDRSAGTPLPTPPSLDTRWARTLLHYWGRTNGLLLLGTIAVLAWYYFTVPIR